MADTPSAAIKDAANNVLTFMNPDPFCSGDHQSVMSSVQTKQSQNPTYGAFIKYIFMIGVTIQTSVIVDFRNCFGLPLNN